MSGYNPYYSGGWQSGESGGTPITPAALNNMESGISAALTEADVVNRLDSTATNKPLSAAQGKALYDDYYVGKIYGRYVECSYFNSNQLEGILVPPNPPAGYTVRLCFARNIFNNDTLGAKCTGGFLTGTNSDGSQYIRVRGSGFVTNESLDVLVYWEYIKS